MQDIPVQKQGDFLSVSLPPGASDVDLTKLQGSLVEFVAAERAAGVIIDVTAAEVLDSFAVRTIRDIADRVRLGGAKTVVVGIQPEVAYAMVQLGLSLDKVTTALDMKEGIADLKGE